MAGSGVYGYRVEGQGLLQIEGLREVQRDLRRLGDSTKTEMKETHREAGEVVARVAKTLAPVRTGRLASTIISSPTQRQGRVRVGRGQSIPYAGPIHFGWPARRISPQPFIYDALDSRQDEVRRIYERRIGELIRKYDLAPGQRSTLNR
jgi:HK97 gp10 family phage protein